MPTRIVLDTNPVPSQLSPKRHGFPHVHINPMSQDTPATGDDKDKEGFGSSTRTAVRTNKSTVQESTQSSALRRRNKNTPNNNTNVKSFGSSAASRRTSGFRSSILRELSVRQDSPVLGASSYHEDEDAASHDNRVRVSSGDIRASPRFLGYLFAAIAGSVLLVSVIQFYEKEVLTQDAATAYFLSQNVSQSDAESDASRFFVTSDGDLVYRWKLWGAIWAGGTIVGLCAIIMIVHYDTIFLPKLWMAMFRDGSLAERNLVIFLIIYWMAGLHICTSSLSVGEIQANVYFTSWITFGSICLTYGVWRESAGLSTLIDLMNQFKRETTYNWIWILIFSIVFAGAATDIYYNRDEIELRYQGEIVDLRRSRWIWVLAIVWAEVAFCFMAILFNEIFTGYVTLPCTCTREAGTYRCALGWRQFEGLAICIGLVAKFWVIWEYTGVDGVINGLSNAYFGIWGSFFNSVFALGTWLKENQHTEYLVRDEDDADEQALEVVVEEEEEEQEEEEAKEEEEVDVEG